MVSEMLSTVASCESDCAQRTAETKKQADEMIRDAKARAASFLSDRQKTDREAGAASAAQAESDRTALLQKSAAQAEADCAAIRSSSEAGIDRAAAVVAEMILSGGADLK